jgi:hypothetical protein
MMMTHKDDNAGVIKIRENNHDVSKFCSVTEELCLPVINASFLFFGLFPIQELVGSSIPLIVI